MSLGAYWVGGANISEVSEKQIARLTSLHERHRRYLSDEDQQQALALLNYNIGRIKHKNGHQSDALALLTKALVSRSIPIRLKALMTIAQVRLRQWLQFRNK
jgi:hypothetical protein